MNKLKTGITLVILGNVLYVSKDFFCNILPSDFGDLIQGLFLGIGVAINAVGIVLVFMHIAKEKKENNNLE